jgi:hypothetical protein
MPRARKLTDPFHVDDHNDTEQASDGHSRFGAYIRQNLHEFHDDDPARFSTDPVQFATAAFYVASQPVMAPGYVRTHPRILLTTCDDNTWDGSLLATVDLAAPGLNWCAWPATPTGPEHSATTSNHRTKGRWRTARRCSPPSA